jgi:hypothetical protein
MTLCFGTLFVLLAGKILIQPGQPSVPTQLMARNERVADDKVADGELYPALPVRQFFFIG